MVYATPDQKAERIDKLLTQEIVPMFGVLEALLSDRGKCWESENLMPPHIILSVME